QFTGQPVRHLWVADSFDSICRMDPEIDAPGPWHMSDHTCEFFVVSGGAAIPFGGQFAYDPARHFLYFVDDISAGEGVIRIGFNPAGDSGHGTLDLTSGFTLASTAGADNFLGGTGCILPTAGTQPSGAALSPLGDLYVGFLDSGDILRFNSPGTASETGFSTCAQFVQKVATTPDGALSNGLAWIGHDLWGGDGTSPFVIPNADTTCLVPPRADCTTANGTVIPTLAAVGATGPLVGDQFYPQTNGNNLYFGVGAQIAWVGNVAGSPAGQTLTVTYITDPLPDPPLAAIAGLAVDGTDPANLVVYSAEDPAPIVVPPTLGAARWWQTTQTSAAPAAPGTPLDVVAVAGNAQATVSWSPAQIAQPVTSYTVRNSFISVGAPLADIVVNPAPGGVYPPTSLVIPGLTNGVSYAFEVSATNANGSSAFSAQSNTITLPGIGLPSAPTGATAVAGDTQAFVTWTVSASNGGSPITSYTVNVLDNGVGTAIFVTVPPPSFGSNTDSALIGGLTNGHSYTFTVQATNIAGFSGTSNLSNAVIPSAANLPTVSIAMSGSTSVTATPTRLTYNITVTNTSLFPASNITVVNTVNTVPASIASASRDASGKVTITLTSARAFAFGQTVTIAGVADPSFNGTFPIASVPNNTSLTYAQAGPVANSVSGTVTVQPQMNIVAASGPGTCTTGGMGVFTVACSVGTLAPGGVARVNVLVQMQNQTITNSATVSGTDEAGTALVSSNASVTTAEPPPPPTNTGVTTDLAITGKAAHGSGKVNSANTYTWTITNKGVDAPNTTFKQVIPSGLRFTSATTTLGTCTTPPVNSLGGTVTCTAPILANADTITVTVNVVINAVGTFNSTGTVSFDGIEAKPGNESSTVKIVGQ
ncbi:MAG TPA: fibronectin type III domain-containing protein, partial [Candidatus Angelobacter sp.]|nr:fibronectin type III domain-containing protein [Candidatus Angelobacter sp.]